MPGYPRYTSDVHQQFQNIIKSMNRDIGVTVATSNSLFHQENMTDIDISGQSRHSNNSGRLSHQGKLQARAVEELWLGDLSHSCGLYQQTKDNLEEGQRVHCSEHEQPDQEHVQTATICRHQGGSLQRSLLQRVLGVRVSVRSS